MTAALAGRVAFYAPMKPPDHPVPSGDRRIARLTMAALGRAGFGVELASRLRVIDTEGSAEHQSRLMAEAATEAHRVCESLAADPPRLWFTYHTHYKAPDLIGPEVARRLRIPYVVSEASVSPRRHDGPWARFAAASDAAIAAADLVFWTTGRDEPALRAAGHGPRMRHLPAFVEVGAPPPRRRGAAGPLQLLTVAMMRPGDKLESYRRLAAALGRLRREWSLTVVGDGPARREVDALLAVFGPRVSFAGAIDDDAALGEAYCAADLLVWPGVNEGVGMVWLEAQAAGCPVVAEDGPAARALVHSGRLVPALEPEAFADAIADCAKRLPALSVQAREAMKARHSIEAAAGRLATCLAEVLR